MIQARIIKAAPCAALLVLFAACTTSDQAVNLPDGAIGYRISCGGMPFSGSGDCLDRAQSRCGDAGYTVIKQSDPAYAHSQLMWDLTTRDMLVQCNANPHDIMPQN
jgi:hypothetical protein